MTNEYIVQSTVKVAEEWEVLAQRLFSRGPVGILEGDKIHSQVIGYTDDPVYGKLIAVKRLDAPRPAHIEDGDG